MTPQQYADALLAEWQSLWFMAPAERLARIDELRCSVSSTAVGNNDNQQDEYDRDLDVLREVLAS